MDISRRGFVKATAVALASAAAAGTMSSLVGCASGEGQSTTAASGDGQKYTSVCRFCGCGCGVIVEAKDGKVIAANMWGKVKTVLQMLSIIFYFFGMAIAANVSWDATVMVVGASVVLCWLVAAVTAISGIKYLWDNRSFINTAK